MSAIAISDPQLVINNQAVPIMPNSMKYNEGEGDVDVSVESTGGGNTTTVYAQDVKTKFSKFSFSMKNTTQNINFVKSIKVLFNQNSATLTDGGNLNFSRSFADFAITNDPDIELGVDKIIEVQCAGSSAT